MFEKPKAKQSRIDAFEVLSNFRQKPCVICQKRPSDPCHIQTFGSGGLTEDWNLIPQCRTHHIEQGKRGWAWMAKKYPQIQVALENKGWIFEEIFGVTKLRNRLHHLKD